MEEPDYRCPRCERNYRLVDLGRDETYFECETCAVELTPVSLTALESTLRVEPIAPTALAGRNESVGVVRAARAPYHLNRILAVGVGAANLVLAALLFVLCVFPGALAGWVMAFTWSYDTHPLRAWLFLALWLSGLAGAAVFAAIGIRSIVTGRWSLTPQIAPLIVTAVLALMVYLE